MDGLLDHLHTLQGVPAYGLLFALLVACGIGAPMNEDVVLLVAAALTLNGVFDPLPLMAVSWAGLLIGDGLVFHWGKRLGPWAMARPRVARIVRPERLAALQDKVRRLGPAAIFLIRFMPGIRTPLFFAAGTLQLKYRTLFTWDGIAAAIELPLLVYGVRWVGGRWEAMAPWLARFQGVLLVALAALAAAAFAAWLWRRRRTA